MWLAPTVELVAQAARDFRTAWKQHGDVPAVAVQWRGGGQEYSHGTMIRRNTMLVAGLQMAGQSLGESEWIERALNERVGLVVFDEAHQSAAPTFQELVERIRLGSQAPLLGLSATPGRIAPLETQELAAMYGNHKVSIGDGGNPVRYLVERGYLAEANISTHLVAGGASTMAGGNDSHSVLEDLGNVQVRNQQIVEMVQDLIDQDHMRVIVFTPSVASAETCAAKTRDWGISSHAVFGGMSRESREHHINTFSTPVSSMPSPQVMFNCNVLTAGFDAPEISAAVIGQPTKSAVRLQQMIGRALRGPKSGGTENADIKILVDDNNQEFADLAEMFCQWDALWEPDRT